jgi:hypothetical protein
MKFSVKYGDFGDNNIELHSFDLKMDKLVITVHNSKLIGSESLAEGTFLLEDLGDSESREFMLPLTG